MDQADGQVFTAHYYDGGGHADTHLKRPAARALHAFGGAHLECDPPDLLAFSKRFPVGDK